MVSSKAMKPLHWSMGRMLLNNQFLAKAKYPSKDTDLSGKTAIITGGNQGLGLESARQLLALKLGHLIIAVRTIEKGEKAADELRAKFPKADIEVWALDLCSYDSVQAFARKAQEELRRLDIAILNAGIFSNNFRINPSTGHEEITQVNYLSTVLLATLLLPIAKEKKASSSQLPVITIVSSGLALQAALKNRNEVPLLASFDDKKHFDSQGTYPNSKLLGHLWLWHAAEYVDSNDVILSCVDPGYVKDTSLHRDMPRVVMAIAWLFSQMLGRKPQVGASTYVDAVVTKGKESHGSFLMSWEVMPFADMLYTPEGQKVADRLWAETMEELEFANVEGILKSMKKSQ